MDSLWRDALSFGTPTLVAVMAWLQRHWRVCRWCVLTLGILIGISSDHLLFASSVQFAAWLYGAFLMRM